MKFIRDLMTRKSKEQKPTAPSKQENVAPFEDVIGLGEERLQPAAPAPMPTPKPDPAVERSAKIEVRDVPSDADAVAEESNEILEKLTSRLNEDAAPAGGVNIWDIEDENDTEEAAAPPAPAPRRRRNATRVLGFDSGGPDVVSMFEEAPKAQAAERTKFPVGWILVSDGPGRGECFTLEAGMSQIGRGEDQAIQLDFGDNSISRTNHAAIVYDTDSHTFSLGHGGKKNIVRLNGQPVISNEQLKTGDKIKIGETTLHFVPLCSEDFNWADEDGDDEENDNVAIA